MEKLNFAEIDKVGGAYLRLPDFELLVKLNNNKIQGGILYTNHNAPMRKEKFFPLPPALLD